MIPIAESAILKLDNQKNGWMNVCINQEANGDHTHCPVRTRGQRILHMYTNNTTAMTNLSTYYDNRSPFEVTAEHTSKLLKDAAAVLKYPTQKGIPFMFCPLQIL
jgi:hypothetical protein